MANKIPSGSPSQPSYGGRPFEKVKKATNGLAGRSVTMLTREPTLAIPTGIHAQGSGLKGRKVSIQKPGKVDQLAAQFIPKN